MMLNSELNNSQIVDLPQVIILIALLATTNHT